MRYVVLAVDDNSVDSVIAENSRNSHVLGTKEVFLDELDEDTFDTANLLT